MTVAGYDADERGSTFVVGYQICYVAPPREFPKQNIGTSSDPFDAAHAYATELFDTGFDVVVDRGCLTGFGDAGRL